MEIILQPADILFTRENTVASWLIRLAQGDCDWSHVCLADGQGSIHTTGGKSFAYYGSVNADKYLHKKCFAVGRYKDLSAEQASLIMSRSKKLFGNFYPFWKVIHLAWLGLRGKKVKQVGGPFVHDPKNTFCSESVALCYEAADITLSPREGKAEPQAYTPESIFNDPNMTIIYFNSTYC
jgi:hypothetical protein